MRLHSNDTPETVLTREERTSHKQERTPHRTIGWRIKPIRRTGKETKVSVSGVEAGRYSPSKPVLIGLGTVGPTARVYHEARKLMGNKPTMATKNEGYCKDCKERVGMDYTPSSAAMGVMACVQCGCKWVFDTKEDYEEAGAERQKFIEEQQ